uniref:Uncharacterized protein n=2 Tax=Kalanchoe fedtschenkoi TaxID=63787 RepID=A0A7N0UWT2_KALFE
MPSVLFITAAHNNQIARLTIYQVIRENNGKLGYVLVRVTKRVCEVYFAQLYLTKVQIQVNKSVVFGDKMKVMDSRVPTQSATSIGTLLITERDRQSMKEKNPISYRTYSRLLTRNDIRMFIISEYMSLIPHNPSDDECHSILYTYLTTQVVADVTPSRLRT